MLECHSVTKKFGDLTVLNHLNLTVREEKIHGLIGPNGAGKTTLLNVVNGFYKPDEGRIYFKGQRIDNLKVHTIARKGIGRTFQITKLFRRMTVMENLVAAGCRLYRSKNRKPLENNAMELMEFLGLDRLANELTGNLSGGQQRLAELARALICEPDFVLLDEPFHAIHPSFKLVIIQKIRNLSRKYGKTFLIVSHDIPSVADCCDTISVLCAGKLIAEGAPDDIRKDEKVIEAYLGV